jgi:hypothetical protein
MTDQPSTQERCPDCFSPFPAVRGLTLLIGTDCRNPFHDQPSAQEPEKAWAPVGIVSYEIGYRDGESSVTADIIRACIDDWDIEIGEGETWLEAITHALQLRRAGSQDVGGEGIEPTTPGDARQPVRAAGASSRAAASLPTTQERCPTCNCPHRPSAPGDYCACTDPWHEQRDVGGARAASEGGRDADPRPEKEPVAPSTTTQQDLQTLRDAVSDAYSLDAFKTLHSDARGALGRIEIALRLKTIYAECLVREIKRNPDGPGITADELPAWLREHG